MPCVDQDVVSEIKFLKHADAPQEFRLQKKAVVRLALDNVADTKKFRIRGEFRYLRMHIERTKINPSHNSENVRSRCGQIQKPTCFFQSLSCLDSNGAVESGCVELNVQIFGQEVVAETGH